MRRRLFRRTRDSLWRKAITPHATADEAEAEARLILGLYRRFQEEWLALPVLTGLKTDSERFAGAVRTYALEGLMQDNKAMQAGAPHLLRPELSKGVGGAFLNGPGGLGHPRLRPGGGAPPPLA